MSYPLDYEIGSDKYQSLITRCLHGVYRPLGNPVGKSSHCEICNGNSRLPQAIAIREMLAAQRKLEKIIPSPVEPGIIIGDPEIIVAGALDALSCASETNMELEPVGAVAELTLEGLGI